MLAFSVTKTGRYICGASSYCDNNDNNVEAVLTFIVAITARSKCTANSYCVLTVIVTITVRSICSANS